MAHQRLDVAHIRPPNGDPHVNGDVGDGIERWMRDGSFPPQCCHSRHARRKSIADIEASGICRVLSCAEAQGLSKVGCDLRADEWGRRVAVAGLGWNRTISPGRGHSSSWRPSKISTQYCWPLARLGTHGDRWAPGDLVVPTVG